MKLSNRVWANIRAKYEAGQSGQSLAREYGISQANVNRRAKNEGWTKDIGERLRRRTEEKVAELRDSQSPAKKVKALDAEAGRIAAVRLRHRKEWEQVVALRQEALALRKPDTINPDREDINQAQKDSFNAMKLAKITSEVTQIQQQGERKAWGMENEVVQASDVQGFRVVME